MCCFAILRKERGVIGIVYENLCKFFHRYVFKDLFNLILSDLWSSLSNLCEILNNLWNIYETKSSKFLSCPSISMKKFVLIYEIFLLNLCKVANNLWNETFKNHLNKVFNFNMPYVKNLWNVYIFFKIYWLPMKIYDLLEHVLKCMKKLAIIYVNFQTSLKWNSRKSLKFINFHQLSMKIFAF